METYAFNLVIVLLGVFSTCQTYVSGTHNISRLQNCVDSYNNAMTTSLLHIIISGPPTKNSTQLDIACSLFHQAKDCVAHLLVAILRNKDRRLLENRLTYKIGLQHSLLQNFCHEFDNATNVTSIYNLTALHSCVESSQNATQSYCSNATALNESAMCKQQDACRSFRIVYECVKLLEVDNITETGENSWKQLLKKLTGYCDKLDAGQIFHYYYEINYNTTPVKVTTSEGGANEDYNTTKGGANENHATTKGGANENHATTKGGANENHTTTKGGANENHTTTKGGSNENHTTTKGAANIYYITRPGGVMIAICKRDIPELPPQGMRSSGVTIQQRLALSALVAGVVNLGY